MKIRANPFTHQIQCQSYHVYIQIASYATQQIVNRKDLFYALHASTSLTITNNTGKMATSLKRTAAPCTYLHLSNRGGRRDLCSLSHSSMNMLHILKEWRKLDPGSPGSMTQSYGTEFSYTGLSSYLHSIARTSFQLVLIISRLRQLLNTP